VRVIAITNQKGGVGKTTTCVNLAAALAERGKRVLVIDLDPQGSASICLGRKGTGDELFQVLTGNGRIADIAVVSSAPGVWVVPGGQVLAAFESMITGRTAVPQVILKRQLEGLDYDVVLIDCAPSLGLLPVNALVAAHEFLVPVEPHFLSIEGVVQLLQTTGQLQEYLNPTLVHTGLLLCRYDSRHSHGKEIVKQLRAHFGEVVFTTVIRNNIALAEASSHLISIFEYEKQRKEHFAGAEDYRALAGEVLARGAAPDHAKASAAEGTP